MQPRPLWSLLCGVTSLRATADVSVIDTHRLGHVDRKSYPTISLDHHSVSAISGASLRRSMMSKVGGVFCLNTLQRWACSTEGFHLNGP
jgi:hypothetical protein